MLQIGISKNSSSMGIPNIHFIIAASVDALRGGAEKGQKALQTNGFTKNLMEFNNH
jgi:hypothetical protein